MINLPRNDMKARFKATGEIIDVISYNKDGFAYIQDDGETVYEFHELEILDDPYYWDKLLHQYAGMAMQAILSNLGNTISPDYLVEEAEAYATALVEKLKDKEEK